MIANPRGTKCIESELDPRRLHQMHWMWTVLTLWLWLYDVEAMSDFPDCSADDFSTARDGTSQPFLPRMSLAMKYGASQVECTDVRERPYHKLSPVTSNHNVLT